MAVEVFTTLLPKRDIGPNSMSGFSFGRGGWGRVTSTAGWPGLLQAGCVSTRNSRLTFCGMERSFLFNARADVSCATHPA